MIAWTTTDPPPNVKPDDVDVQGDEVILTWHAGNGCVVVAVCDVVDRVPDGPHTRFVYELRYLALQTARLEAL
jgi:hypothetical protein